jgi:hypothetical protein
MNDRHPLHRRLQHPLGTIAAAVLLGAATFGMLTAGSPFDEDRLGPEGTTFGFPVCVVDVHREGSGANRHAHVSVSSDNDVEQLWLVVDGGEPIEVRADHGWAHHVLADAALPDEVVVYGSPALEDSMAGCHWPAPVPET